MFSSLPPLALAPTRYYMGGVLTCGCDTWSTHGLTLLHLLTSLPMSHLTTFVVSGNDPWRQRLLTLREALRMPLPEPDPPNEPQPDSVEGKSAAYRTTSPAGGVVTWEMAPGGQVSLINAIRQFADSAEDTVRR